MNRPIRTALIATLLLAPPSIAETFHGAIGVLVNLFAVFFGSAFLLLLLLHLYYNRKWRIDPGPQWRGSIRHPRNRSISYPGTW